MSHPKKRCRFTTSINIISMESVSSDLAVFCHNCSDKKVHRDTDSRIANEMLKVDSESASNSLVRPLVLPVDMLACRWFLG